MVPKASKLCFPDAHKNVSLSLVATSFYWNVFCLWLSWIDAQKLCAHLTNLILLLWIIHCGITGFGIYFSPTHWPSSVIHIGWNCLPRGQCFSPTFVPVISSQLFFITFSFFSFIHSFIFFMLSSLVFILPCVISALIFFAMFSPPRF